MALARIDENELLAPLHQGALEEAAWLVFLARLRRRAGADYAGLLMGRADGPADEARELFVRAPDEAAIRQGWQEAYHRHDPLPHRRLRAGRPYGGSDFPDPTDPAHAGYARQVMAAGGFTDQRVLRVTEPRGACIWLMLACTNPILGAAESALLGSLAPHLEIALETSAALTQARERAALSERTAARLGLGWITLDDLGRPIEAGGHTLPEALHEHLPKTIDTAHSVRIGNGPFFDLHVEPMRDTGSLSHAVAIAHLRQTALPARDPIGSLIDLYALSRNEARLAWGLCEGMSIADASKMIGLTIETARNYSKRIYAKVGASGQADLVRIILGGVAAMA